MKVLVLGLFLLPLLGQSLSSSTTATTATTNANTSISSTTASPSVMSTSSTNSMGGGANSMGGAAPGNVNYMVGMTTKSGQSHMLASVSLLLASLGLHTLWQ